MIRVLVVDDDPNVRFTVRMALEGAPPDGDSMEIQEADSGTVALHALQTQTFDVVLLDVMMPGTDGFGVLAAIREDGEEPAVIMLTARGREVDIVNAYRAGADGFVTKPFEVDDLASVTRRIALAPPVERRQRRAMELERAELLLQLEHGFGAGPHPPAAPSR